jgi:hypothetical protein
LFGWISDLIESYYFKFFKRFKERKNEIVVGNENLEYLRDLPN